MGTNLELTTEIQRILSAINDYGGGAKTHLIRSEVLAAIEKGASEGDQTLQSLKCEMLHRARAIQTVEDHAAFSSFFDIYCEATFYLAASRHVQLEGIPRSSSSTPDFRTAKTPKIHFEIKTPDIADPMAEYPEQMTEGLQGKIEAIDEAQQKSVGVSEQVIRPHGDARTWHEAMVQTMKKLSGNIKKSQYEVEPTFLVANLGRLSVRVEAEQLSQTYSIPADDISDGQQVEVSGQLWTISNHQMNDDFHWIERDGQRESKVIELNGLLRDYHFIQGIIFVNEPWSEFENSDNWRDSYRFLGVWNEDCTITCDATIREAARKILNKICERVVSTKCQG